MLGCIVVQKLTLLLSVHPPKLQLHVTDWRIASGHACEQKGERHHRTYQDPTKYLEGFSRIIQILRDIFVEK